MFVILLYLWYFVFSRTPQRFSHSQFSIYRIIITVLVACRSPDLFTVIGRYSSFVFSGLSNKAKQYAHKVTILSGKVK